MGSERQRLAALLDRPEPANEVDVDPLDHVALVRRLHAHALAHHRRQQQESPTGRHPTNAAPTLWDTFHDQVARTLLDPVQADLTRMAPAFHTVGRHVAYRLTRAGATDTQRETPELHWLLSLGISADNWKEITIWFYRYATWDQPDDRSVSLLSIPRLRMASRAP